MDLQKLFNQYFSMSNLDKQIWIMHPSINEEMYITCILCRGALFNRYLNKIDIFGVPIISMNIEISKFNTLRSKTTERLKTEIYKENFSKIENKYSEIIKNVNKKFKI